MHAPTQEMVDLFNDDRPFNSFDSSDEYFDHQESLMDKYMEIGEGAKNDDSIIGRVFHMPVADGSALYMIFDHIDTDRSVIVFGLNVYDNYRDSTIECMNGILPIDFVMPIVTMQERMNGMSLRAPPIEL